MQWERYGEVPLQVDGNNVTLIEHLRQINDTQITNIGHINDKKYKAHCRNPQNNICLHSLYIQ